MAPRRRPRRRRLLMALVLVIVAALIASTIYHLDQLALGPGEALPVTGPHGLISVPHQRSHPVHGRILLTTVSVSSVRAIDWVFDKLNSNVALVPTSEVFGNLSSSQFQQYDTAAMTFSQQSATVVALRQLGYQVQEHPGATIVEVAPGSPASKGGVPLGSVLVAVDGQPVTSANQAVAAIRGHRPGEQVRLTVEKSAGGAPRTVSVTVAARPHHPGEGYLGIAVTDGAWFQLPFEVEVTSAGIGGPSAGLAFTLGIIDELSSGDLTGGKTVAATGVINLNGTVGDVGGVAQKTVAVRQAGASVFLVPTKEYRTAESKAGPHLRVVAVANVAQALMALEHLGGHVAA
ncbi:MAG: PDZ domain-containing protein [Acidimicrobiales bacterium]|nr:PDZ domain-containing protein [Acidimicrobiales bacterium]